jgi:orotidine-5'-phosphate decarboxylase
MCEAWQRLAEATAAAGGPLCVGVDPQPASLPRFVSTTGDPLYSFGRDVIEATTGLASAYKFNIAFFEAAGSGGIDALRQLVSAVSAPVLAIIDAKRGDVAHTSRAYALALFDHLGADALTVNPYLGYDGVEPFLCREDKGVFVLCRTSNPGAIDFQQLSCEAEGGALPLYVMVARKVAQWNERHGNCGLVVGATAPDEIKVVRDSAGGLPLLLPGVGAQGGPLEAAVRAAQGGAFLVNVSRSLIPDGLLGRGDWLDGVRGAAESCLSGIKMAIEQGGATARRSRSPLSD